MRSLQIQLLGDFHICHGNGVVAGLDTPRLQSVLSYLLVHRQAPQLRHHVAFALWPTSTESQAHTNLRKQVYHLRRALPDAERFLHVDGRTIHWRPEAPWILDLAEFESALAAAEKARKAGDSPAAEAALRRASDIYAGDLLPSCYDDWILAPRERLLLAHIRALDQLARSLEAKRDFPGAARYVHRLLRHDPLRESAYRRLMRLHALNGDRAKGVETYQRCAAALERELGVEPCHATRATYERLLADRPRASPRAPSPAPAPTAPALVGRQNAWAQLQIAWQTALRRGPHLALISGEAGLGKTRLAEGLLTWAERQHIPTAATHASTVGTSLAYAPLIRLLRTETLLRAVSELDDVWLTELARLLPELLAQQPALAHPEPLTEGWRRQRLFEAVARAVLAVSQPLILFMDDLQWSDERTLAWLHYLHRFEPQARILVVGAVRPGEITDGHPLSPLLTELRGRRALTEIELEPLSAADTAALALQTAGRQLDAREKAWLYRETEGNPLFIVETVRAGVSSAQLDSTALARRGPARRGALTLGPAPLPPKVRAVIERQLNQLSPEARDVLGVAAVVGRRFPLSLVAGASQHPEAMVVTALDELRRRGIVRQGEGDLYDFSHHKICETAYAGLSPARRHFLRRRVAQAANARFTDDPSEPLPDLSPRYQADCKVSIA